MRSRQIAERLGVEEAHMLEFQQFNIIWDKKMNEFEMHAEELVEAMKERHAAELRDYQRKLMGKQIRPKFSKDLLNLRKNQETLAKQKTMQRHSKSSPNLMHSRHGSWRNGTVSVSRTCYRRKASSNLSNSKCLWLYRNAYNLVSIN
mmetsp:Transcript_26740/g.36826  ORF Transcript_26740/g.36826 Transcript_26740/m.36826 type:complete len:147 (-) Transcript_26740:445-885(-)